MELTLPVLRRRTAMAARARCNPVLVVCLALLMVATVCSGDARPLNGSGDGPVAPDVALVDPEATDESRALFANLRGIAGDQVLFGHQDSLAYGVGWANQAGRSDVHDVTGAYPAVYGWDVGDIETGADENLDEVDFEAMQRWMREGYERGGVITVSWHMGNPVSGGDAWDTTRAIHTILPGGEHHGAFTRWLDRFAEFVGEVGDIPIIFRPFHEMTESGFWWGGQNVTPQEYVELWQFTVEYLRDRRSVHNLLYAYAPDWQETASEQAYLTYYPGDEYVDVFGYDDYISLISDATVPEMTRRLQMIVELAEARGKIAALTETGLKATPHATWWTGRLLRAITADPVSRRISYVLLWRNASEQDHYVPYPGHLSEPDFVRFYDDPLIVFGDTVPDLYH